MCLKGRSVLPEVDQTRISGPRGKGLGLSRIPLTLSVSLRKEGEVTEEGWDAESRGAVH